MHVYISIIITMVEKMVNGAYIMYVGLHATLSMSSIEFHEQSHKFYNIAITLFYL
jgi:hypothetical protein